MDDWCIKNLMHKCATPISQDYTKMKTEYVATGLAQAGSFILLKLGKKQLFMLLISLFRALVNYPVIGSERDKRQPLLTKYVAN